MSEKLDTCARPQTVGPIASPEAASAGQIPVTQEVKRMTARAGKPAPDFETTAFHQGKFSTVKLSDYSGHWILLCFYPGDFTFV